MVPEVPTATKVLFPNSTSQRIADVGEVALSQVVPLSVDLTIFPELTTATKVLFPNPTPKSLFTVGEVTLSKDDPLSVDLTIFPALPANTNALEPEEEEPEEEESSEEETVKVVIVSMLLSFPAESVTLIVQSEYVPSLKEIKMIVLFPIVAWVVPDEQEPPYVMVPASSEENV